MKRSKKYRAIILVVLMTLSMGTVNACGQTKGTASVVTAVSGNQTTDDQTAGSQTESDDDQKDSSEKTAGEEQEADSKTSATSAEYTARITLTGSSASVDGSGAKLTDNDEVTISESGTYYLTGNLNDGKIVVDNDEAEVTLVLDGVNISDDDKDAIFIKNAKKAKIILAEGSKNTLTSGTEENYSNSVKALSETTGTATNDKSQTDGKDAGTAVNEAGQEVEQTAAKETEEKATEESEKETGRTAETESEENGQEESQTAETEEEDTSDFKKSERAAIFADCELEISGSGSLTVNGYINNGIQAKGKLTIDTAEITITALNDAVKGSDVINIISGSYKIDSYGDGIVSSTDVVITDGTFDITTGGGSPETTVKGQRPDFTQGENSANTEDQASADIQNGQEAAVGPDSVSQASENAAPESLESGEQQFAGRGPRNGNFGGRGPRSGNSGENSFDGNMPEGGFGGKGFGFSNDLDSKSDSVSQKGIKADGSITIEGGTFKFDTYDDSIHADTDVVVNGGSLEIATGDDAVHAESKLTINNGSVNVTKSNEGLEGNVIEINDGTIDIISSDDGINASGNKSDIYLTINGGSITVDSEGDGLDSNGDMEINGGNILVNGPENSGNSAIDVASENGGLFTVNGGSIIASGMSQMTENSDSSSKQNSILFQLGSTLSAGTTVDVTDSAGNKITSITLKKAANCIFLSSGDIKTGETYTFTYNGTSESIETDSVNTSNVTGGMGGFRGRGFNGTGDMNGMDGMNGSEDQGIQEWRNPQNGSEDQEMQNQTDLQETIGDQSV